MHEHDIPKASRRYILRDAQGYDVLGGSVAEQNPYIGGGYGALEPGCKKPADLEIGEVTRKRYALSGQKPTVYWIERVE